MSKKDSLLTEAQVRKFMKLADLTPLAPGFVNGLHTSGHLVPPPQMESHSRSPKEGARGRGKPDQNARLEEDGGMAYRHDDEDLELGADLGAEEEPPEESLEDPLEDPLEEPLEEPLEDVGGGGQVSIEDFLTALEVALEEVLGDEVEVEQEGEEEEEEEELEDLGGEEELEAELGGTEEEEPYDLQEIVNIITKRVAKRIVKETLSKKK
jgi:hypothetical protein